MRSANILCVDQFSDLGGGQRSLLDLLPAFSKCGWSPSVAAPGAGPFIRSLQQHGYSVHGIACGSYSIVKKPLDQLLRYVFEVPATAASLRQAVEVNHIDLLYVNGPRVLPPAAWLAWKMGLPLVFHCHNRLLQGSAIAVAGYALRMSKAHVIACCQYAAEPLVRYIEPARLRIIFNGVEDLARGPIVPRRRLRNIGVVGRVEREKGQLEFVRAARAIFEQFSDCRFTIVGTPMFSGTAYFERVVAESAGLPVEFAGWQDDVATVFSNLDLLVVASTAVEATTRVILEAYAAGVPVVSFPSGGIPEVLRDGVTGFLTSERSVESLALRILDVLSMGETEIGAVVAAARAAWTRCFSLESYRERVCGVVDHVLKLAA